MAVEMKMCIRDSLVGGGVAGVMGAKAFSMGYSSILGVVIFEQTIGAILAGVAASLIAVSYTHLDVYKRQVRI